MRHLKLLLALTCVAALAACSSGPHSAHGQTANNTAVWTWSAPTAFTDGSPIPSTDAITYDVYVGTAGPGSESLTPVVTGVTADTWTGSGYKPGAIVCGEVTSVVNSIESARSNEACKSFPDVPNPPTHNTVK